MGLAGRFYCVSHEIWIVYISPTGWVPAMNLKDILQPDCIKVPLESIEKEAVITELVGVISSQFELEGTDAILSAVLEREKIRTTGIGQGLAIPHCKSSECGDRMLMAIGKPSEPIAFGSIDGNPVSLVILLASPPDRTSEHIQVLAAISRLMLNDEFREAAFAVSSAEELYELFTQREPTKAGI